MILFAFFPSEKEKIEGIWTVSHVIVVGLFTTLVGSCLDTANFSVLFKICDKRVAAVYITILATLANLCSYVHKFYIFALVEKFGLFGPQIALTSIATVMAIVLKSKIEAMDSLPKESWAVSDTILKKVKHA